MNTCPPLTIAIQSRGLLRRVMQVLSNVYTPTVLKFLDNFELQQKKDLILRCSPGHRM